MSAPHVQPPASIGADPAPGAFVSLRGVEKSFGSNRVLRGVDLDIMHGEIFTLLGGSGSGKSVMLKHMVGLLVPDAGRIFVEGVEVTDLDERDWIEIRKRIGYVFQSAALFDSLSVADNVSYALREHLDLSRAEIDQRVADCLESVGLPGIERRMPSELSGGMRKRVGVARAIAMEPRAILYDEPTTGLDPANARRIGELVVDLRARLDVTSVVVTHELDLAFEISDRLAMLDRGQLVVVGTPDEVRACKLPRVEAFLEGRTNPEDADDVWAVGAADPSAGEEREL